MRAQLRSFVRANGASAASVSDVGGAGPGNVQVVKGSSVYEDDVFTEQAHRVS